MDLCKITCGGEIHLDCLMFSERNSVFDLWIYKSEKTSSVGTTNFAHKFIILLPDDGEKQTNKQTFQSQFEELYSTKEQRPTAKRKHADTEPDSETRTVYEKLCGYPAGRSLGGKLNMLQWSDKVKKQKLHFCISNHENKDSFWKLLFIYLFIYLFIHSFILVDDAEDLKEKNKQTNKQTLKSVK